jgi:hypothetical protein
MVVLSRRSALVVAGIVVLAAASCNSARPTQAIPSVNDVASTLVALQFQAATRTAQSRPPTLVAAAPTFEKPRLYVNSDVKCRSSTNPSSKVIASLTAGTSVDMIGKDSAESAWLVMVPNAPIPCWVRVEDSSPGGSFQALPEVTPQPGSGKVPAAPTNLSWNFTCAYKSGVLYTINTPLSWDDPSNDANGFRVYRNDALIADLTSDVKAFTDKSDVVLGTDLTYSVEAYNEAGASPRLSITIGSVCKK